MRDYTIAKYLRISSEDADLKNSVKMESNSISNQRNLLNSYISRVPEFAGATVVEFCDDGWSGKNFDRPAVQEMLRQAQQGKIQCIIVKDMSRFGRDYLIVGNYISRVFPFLGVRFIAINDAVDSIRSEDIDSWIPPLSLCYTISTAGTYLEKCAAQCGFGRKREISYPPMLPMVT